MSATDGAFAQWLSQGQIAADRLTADDDNYAALLKEKVGAKQVVQLVAEYEGKPKVGFAEKPYEGKTAWLRMVSGGRVPGKYRATE